MSALFLRARHWQLFLFFWAIFSLAERAARIGVEAMRDSAMTLNQTILLVLTLPTLCFVLWYLVLGTFLHAVLHPELKRGLTLFRVAVLCTASLSTPFALDARPIGLSLALVLVDGLAFLFATFFLSKILAMAETTRSVTFQDFWGTFLLFVFIPVGIWFLQPRINRLYEAAQGGNGRGPSRLTRGLPFPRFAWVQ